NQPAVAAHGVLLRLRRGAGHHDVAGDAPAPGGVAERQPMVAARVRGYALLRRFLWEAEHGVAGTAHLEDGRPLEVLALEEELGTCKLVNEARGQDRRPVDVRLHALVRGEHILP